MSFTYKGKTKTTFTKVQRAAVLEGLDGAIANLKERIDQLEKDRGNIEALVTEENDQFIDRIEKESKQ